jgi:hypothetical protein
MGWQYWGLRRLVARRIFHIRDDLAVAHSQYAISKGRNVGLMCDHDDGDALLAIERAERLRDPM